MKYLRDYKKAKSYFTKKDHDIYLRLKPHLQNAIRNAIALGTFDDKNPMKALSEMEFLFESIGLIHHFK